MPYSLVGLIVREHVRRRFLFCLRLKRWGQAAMLHGALPSSLAPRGSCTQIMKHLSRAPRVLCRGGLNQACPAPRVPAVPRRTRELPPSSSPLGAAWNTRSHVGSLAWRSQEECVRAPACLPTDFARAELCLRGAREVTRRALSAAVRRGVPLNTCLPARGSGGGGNPFPGPPGDAGGQRGQPAAERCFWLKDLGKVGAAWVGRGSWWSVGCNYRRQLQFGQATWGFF